MQKEFKMGREVVLVGLGLLTVLFLIAFVPAPENETNSTNNETNNTLITSCIDTDGGKDYGEKGRVYTGTGCTGNDCTNVTSDKTYDICLTDKILSEGYCSENTTSFINYTCPEICLDGRCKANVTTTTCDEDSDCPSGKECEDGRCVIDDDDDNETEDDDENETDGDNDDFNDKVCCKLYMKQEIKNGFEERTKYLWIDRDSCTSRENKKDKIFTKEIMNDTSLCRGKFEVKEKQRIKFEDRTGQTCPENCTCTGVVMKCPLEGGGRQMTIFAGKSGNIIIQIQGVNVTTNISIYSENGTLIGEFGNGDIKIIKITPDQLKIKFREKEKIELEDEEIELKDDGFYEYKGKKNARLLWTVPVRERVVTEIDPETGEITKTKSSWWGFLARDKKSE
ncbi:MAG: hypothetical protein AABW51_02405 [Nanoarchaeota archaeon]